MKKHTLSLFWATIYLLFSTLSYNPSEALESKDLNVRAGNLNLAIQSDGRIKGFKTIEGNNTLTTEDPGIIVWDGKKKDEVEFKMIEPIVCDNQNESLKQVEYTKQADELKACHTIYKNGEAIHYKIDLFNKSDEELWLEIRYMGLFRAEGNWSLYDGERNISPVDKEYTKETTFWPAFALAGSNSGLWIGVEPHQLFSLLTYSFKGRHMDGEGEFFFGARIVISPQDTESVEFVFLDYTPDYGYYSALQKYYDSFPDLFWPTEGIDPRICGGSPAQYISFSNASCAGPFSPAEVPRRAHATWDWMYAPVRVLGDYYIREEKYNLTSPELRLDKSWDDVLAYRQNRQNFFYNSDRKYGVAAVFYTIPWVHEDLARKLYADSLMTEDLGWENDEGASKNWIARRNYVKSGPDWQVEVFAWGNSAGENFTRDFKDLANSELPFHAFGMDSNVCAGKYRREGAKIAPGRAWDEGGAFYSEGIAQAMTADYMHSLEKNGYKIAVVPNQALSHYAMAFRADTSMQELIPTRHIIRPGGIIIPREYARVQMGHKPKNIFCHFAKLGYDIALFEGWENSTPEEIRGKLLKTQDLLLLYCLRYGWNLSPDYVVGDARMLKYAKILVDLNVHGHQPVSAMKTIFRDNELYLSRYGKKERSFLVVGNLNETTIESEVKIENKYLGSNSVLFSAYQGEPIMTKNANGISNISFSIIPRDALILKSLVLFDYDGALIGTASNSNDAHGGSIKADFSCDNSNKPVTIKVVVPENVMIGNVKLNGETPIFELGENNILEIRAPGLSTMNSLEVAYYSTKILCEETDLLSFPFVDLNNNIPQAQIVIPEEATDDEENAAFRLVEYFRYWSVMEKGIEIILPIRKESEKENLPTVYIGRMNDIKDKGVSSKEGNIFIIGESPRDTYNLVVDFLYILDKQYPLIGIFQNQNQSNPVHPLLAGEYKDEMEEILRKAECWGVAIRTYDTPYQAPNVNGTETIFTPSPDFEAMTIFFPAINKIENELNFEDKVSSELRQENGYNYWHFKLMEGVLKTARVRLKTNLDFNKGELKQIVIRIRKTGGDNNPKALYLRVRKGSAWNLVIPSIPSSNFITGPWYDIVYDVSSETIDNQSIELYFNYHKSDPCNLDLGEIRAVYAPSDDVQYQAPSVNKTKTTIALTPDLEEKTVYFPAINKIENELNFEDKVSSELRQEDGYNYWHFKIMEGVLKTARVRLKTSFDFNKGEPKQIIIRARKTGGDKSPKALYLRVRKGSTWKYVIPTMPSTDLISGTWYDIVYDVSSEIIDNQSVELYFNFHKTDPCNFDLGEIRILYVPSDDTSYQVPNVNRTETTIAPSPNLEEKTVYLPAINKIENELNFEDKVSSELRQEDGNYFWHFKLMEGVLKTARVRLKTSFDFNKGEPKQIVIRVRKTGGDKSPKALYLRVRKGSTWKYVIPSMPSTDLISGTWYDIVYDVSSEIIDNQSIELYFNFHKTDPCNFDLGEIRVLYVPSLKNNLDS